MRAIRIADRVRVAWAWLVAAMVSMAAACGALAEPTIAAEGLRRLPPVRPPASVFQNVTPRDSSAMGPAAAAGRSPTSAAPQRGSAATRISDPSLAPSSVRGWPPPDGRLEVPSRAGRPQAAPPRSPRAVEAVQPNAAVRRHVSVWQRLADSVEGRPIEFAQFGRGPRNAVVVGPLAGEEVWAVALIDRLAEHLARFPSRLGEWSITLVRSLNPDGYVHRTSTNARGVDLNRNFDTSNWRKVPHRGRWLSGRLPLSEPETRALVDLIDDVSAERVIWIRAADEKAWLSAAPGSELLAQRVATAWNVTLAAADMSPPSGSLLAWLGERPGIDGVCLSVPRRTGDEALWSAYRSVLAALMGLVPAVGPYEADSLASVAPAAPAPTVRSETHHGAAGQGNGNQRTPGHRMAPDNPTEPMRPRTVLEDAPDIAGRAVPARPVGQVRVDGTTSSWGPPGRLPLQQAVPSERQFGPAGPGSGKSAMKRMGTAAVPRVLSADELTDDTPLVEVVRPGRQHTDAGKNTQSAGGLSRSQSLGVAGVASPSPADSTADTAGNGPIERAGVPALSESRSGANGAVPARPDYRTWLRPDIRRLPPVETAPSQPSSPDVGNGRFATPRSNVAPRTQPPVVSGGTPHASQPWHAQAPGAKAKAARGAQSRQRTSNVANMGWPQPPIPLYEPPHKANGR